MGTDVKAFLWVCNDFSDDATGPLEKLAAKFQNGDLAQDFKKQFEAAQQFNIDAKAGKPDSDLVFAAEIEDVDEKQEDDIDVNKTADQEGDE